MLVKNSLLILFILFISVYIQAQSRRVLKPKPVTGFETYNSENVNYSDFKTGKFTNKIQPLINENGTVLFSPTGIRTVYDLQSNAVPQQIWQDPLIPSNVHSVCMYSPFPGFAIRNCAYLFSQNNGATWNYLGDVPNTGRSGFPAITGFVNGVAVIGNHNTTQGTTPRTKLYYDLGPGFGAFTELDPGVTPDGDPIWARVIGINSNKIVFLSSINAPLGPAYTNSTISLIPPGTFSGYAPYIGDQAESYSLAKSNSGRIGHAYIGREDVDVNDAFYRSSTDNGLTWSFPVKIWDWDLSDSLGVLRGISMIFIGENPVVAFNTSPISDLGEFFPERPSQIRIWNPTVNNGIAVIAADSHDVPFFPNLGNVDDAFLPLCRPAIGKSSTGDILIIGFSATTGQYSNLDSSSYFATWITFSFNGGASWGNHEKITPTTPLRDWRFISVSPTNNISGNTLTVQMLCQSDSLAGTHVNGSPIGIGEMIGIRYVASINTIPAAPTLISPANGAINISLTPLLDWSNVFNANTYRLEISRNSNFTNLVFETSTLTTSQFSVTPGLLTYDSVYYWRVNATNLNGTGPWSTVFNFRTISFYPPAPVLVSPANGSTNISLTPILNWNDIPGVLHYALQVATDSSFINSVITQTNLSTSQFTVPSMILSSNVRYYWRVNATNINGSGPWSAIWNFTTGSIPLAPTLVFPLNGATGISLTPTLDWENVTGASSYRVQLATDSNLANVILDQSNITASQLLVPAPYLTYNSKYYWRVNASNAFGTGPWTAIWNFTTGNIPPPAAPTLLSPPNNSMNIILTPLLDWNIVSDANGYRVNIATDVNFTNIVLDQSIIAVSQYTVPPMILNHNTLYFWRVNSFNAGGSGPWSQSWTFRTIPTGINIISTEIPDKFKLYDNYPNPFNPSTKIRFDLVQLTEVKLKVYDFLGREVKSILDDKLSAGSYEVEFSATDLSSGVYIYRIEAGNFIATKRMFLIK